MPSRRLRYYLLARASLFLEYILVSPTVTALQVMAASLRNFGPLFVLMYHIALNRCVSRGVSWNERTRTCVGSVRDQFAVNTNSELYAFLFDDAILSLCLSAQLGLRERIVNLV